MGKISGWQNPSLVIWMQVLEIKEKTKLGVYFGALALC